MHAPVAQALNLGPREVVVLVGGGGKTTTLFRLARELLLAGSRVIATTTTHIFEPAPAADLEAIVEPDADRGLQACQAALGRRRLPVVGTRLTPDGKLAGVSPEVVDLYASHADIAYVVVEADGSAHKPFKAPLDYEPVVPASATLLIALVGLDALGMPLDADHIHRPQRVAELSGAALGEPLTAEAIASVLVHPLGPLRAAPPSARTLVLLNKADSPDRCAAAAHIVRALEAHDGPPVLVGALAADKPF